MRTPALLAGLAALAASCLSGPCLAGQAVLVPVSELIHRDLVAVVQVTNVRSVEVPTDGNGITRVDVAEAEVVRPIRPLSEGFRPKPFKIVIVGSSIPRSSAVWRPIEKGRYLAFLHAEQGHYRYREAFAFRRIAEDGSVMWYDYERQGPPPQRIGSLPEDEAVARISKLLQAPSR